MRELNETYMDKTSLWVEKPSEVKIMIFPRLSDKLTAMYLGKMSLQ